MSEGQIPPPPPPNPMDPGTPPGGPYVGPEPTKDDKTMAMLCHLLAIFTWFLGPLIIWIMKKDTSPFVDDQGKEALNFQLTMLIAWVAAGIIAAITCGIGMVLFPVLWVVTLIFCIMGTMAANRGEAYRYPLTLRLLK